MEQIVARLYSFHIVLMVVCAVFYYKAADMEHAPAILWTGLSILAFLITWLILGWGWLGCLGGQALLFAGITAARIVRARSRKE